MNPSLVLKSNSENEMMTSRWDGSRTPQQFKQVSEVQLKKITLLPFFPSVGYTRTF